MQTYETLPSGLRVPKIGFGTWKIGGGNSADSSLDDWSLAALRSALALGYTHFDTAEMYANGHAEELLGRAVRETGVERESLLITSKVTPSNLGYKSVLRACASSLRRLGMDYLDIYLIHWPAANMPLEDSFRALNQLVAEGKVRHIGVSNFDLPLLRRSQALCATTIVTNQVPYSLGDRSYVKNGMLAYCQENDILLTAYSPVEEGQLKNSPALSAIADAHKATPQQIALAWLVQQPRVITIPMSGNPAHQADNLTAGEIVLSEEECALLN
ncbi:MAG: aldo/keto reductase [Chloroflexi bacterium]|nr:MAG: aldo/keto reductase [Chloroflexota bacterium]